MTETMIPYDTSEQAAVNGQEVKPFVDNRYVLEVDPKQIETWELAVLESGKISEWMFIFARYLTQNGRPVSPELPDTPLDEMGKKERVIFTNSKAYKVVKHYKIHQLRDAAQAITASLEQFDPN